MEILNLKKKNFLLLGGSGLIGNAFLNYINKLCKSVIVLDNQNLKIKSKNILNHYYDISSNNFDKEFSLIIKKYKKIDCFVNCSYPIFGDWSKTNFNNLSYLEMTENINLQLERNIWLTNLLSKHMVKNKVDGSIVLMNSIYGILGYDPNLYKKTNMRENITYSLIKGGISNYIRTMAPILSKKKIRINSVCSGGVEGHISGENKSQSKQFKLNYSKKVPLGRLAYPKEIAGSIVFLCSDLSSYVTGTNLIVDGGFSAI